MRGRMRSMGACPCGDSDCWEFGFGYPYCTGCEEHHRSPVANETEDPWCPVDFNSAVLDELDQLPADAPSDQAAAAATVRERFVEALRVI